MRSTGRFPLILWLVAMAARSFVSHSEPLPFDPAIRYGELENGLTYYVRENSKPENRAALRLVVNAGSILEEEDQRGLAHFLEHMAFNGTRRFEKQALVDFLEGVGMRFGPDLNAYTSFDETVYMLEIPLDDADIVSKAFQILEDWASGISLEIEEIDKERGVVLEEWRLGRGAQGRVQDKQIPILFHESRYGVRLPIGEPAVIESAPREAFTRFYENWYRPDLMAVIVVGDFDGEVMEARVREQFGALPVRDGAPERAEYFVPDHEETLVSIETDPELTMSMVQIAYKRDPEASESEEDYRRSIVESLYVSLLNQRLSERMLDTEPPYLGAGVGKMNLVREKDIVYQAAAIREGQLESGLTALLVEAKRARRDGFSEGELARAKSNLVRSLQAAYEERDKTESSAYAEEYTRNFLTGEPIPVIAKELEMTERFAETISIEEVNRVADDWTTETNRVVLYAAPSKEGLEPPTRDALLAMITAADAQEIEVYEDTALDGPLLSSVPEPGSIVETVAYPEIDAHEWRLSNGAKVVVKATDFKNDEILVSAFSPGGVSLASDEAFVSADDADVLIGQSGLGEFDFFQLNKRLAGAVVSVSPQFGELSEGVSGATSPKDLETFFQLLHLVFTAPRADERILGLYKAQLADVIANRSQDPNEVFADAILKARFGDHPRRQPLSASALEALDLDAAFDFYRDRFADAGDFTFVLVGALDLEALKPLVETYVASLPSAGRKETWRNIGARPASGPKSVRVEKGIEPKSSVRVYFHGDATWSTQERYHMRSAVEALRIRLRKSLREEQGGTYGVSVAGSLSRDPETTFNASVAFGCAPDNVDSLLSSLWEAVESMGQSGATAEELSKVQEGQRRGYELGLQQNAFWLSNLEFLSRYQVSPESVLEFPNRVDELTSEDIATAVRKYFQRERAITAVLVPETVVEE